MGAKQFNRRIARLNDAFRKHGVGTGTVVIHDQVRRLGQAFVGEVLFRVRNFSDFTPECDPFGEHEEGHFEVAGRMLRFKIDCFDQELMADSPDPSDPVRTHRVLTISIVNS